MEVEDLKLGNMDKNIGCTSIIKYCTAVIS